jgi:hypothetical protein
LDPIKRVIGRDGLEPFTLLPGQAADLTLIWPWSGEPYAILRMSEYRFAIHLE